MHHHIQLPSSQSCYYLVLSFETGSGIALVGLMPWVLGSQVCTAVLCSAGDGTHGFVHAKWALCQLSYMPSLRVLNILYKKANLIHEIRQVEDPHPFGWHLELHYFNIFLTPELSSQSHLSQHPWCVMEPPLVHISLGFWREHRVQSPTRKRTNDPHNKMKSQVAFTNEVKVISIAFKVQGCRIIY